MSARQERRRIAQAMRAEGQTWGDVANHFRERYQVNARKAMRWAHGWTQDDVANEWSKRWPDDIKTAQTISCWESWPQSGHTPSLHVLDCLAKIYKCDLADLVADLGCHSLADTNRHRPVISSITELDKQVAKPANEGNDEAVNRREFTRVAALSVLGLASPWQALTEPRRRSTEIIGHEHVDIVQTALGRIESYDAARGSEAVRPAVTRMRQQVQEWLSGQHSLEPGVDKELQAALGALDSWSGWLAYDCNDHTTAEKHLKDALLQARFTDDLSLEVEALDTLSLLARHSRPREALHCAEAAQRSARGWATARLSALLHLRITHAHAQLGEHGAFSREISKAMRYLDNGTHEDDPLFVQFVTPMELTGIRGLCLLALSKPERAATEFQTIIDNPDPSYHRNVVWYHVKLAHAQAAARDITAASETGLSAIGLVGDVRSPRATNHLADLRTTIEPHRRSCSTAEDFASRYDTEMAHV